MHLRDEKCLHTTDNLAKNQFVGKLNSCNDSLKHANMEAWDISQTQSLYVLISWKGNTLLGKLSEGHLKAFLDIGGSTALIIFRSGLWGGQT